MNKHSIARTQAETQFERTHRKAEEGVTAKSDHEVRDAAVTANTARLKALRLDRERADTEAASLLPPPEPAKKTRTRSRS